MQTGILLADRNAFAAIGENGRGRREIPQGIGGHSSVSISQLPPQSVDTLPHGSFLGLEGGQFDACRFGFSSQARCLVALHFQLRLFAAELVKLGTQFGEGLFRPLTPCLGARCGCLGFGGQRDRRSGTILGRRQIGETPLQRLEFLPRLGDTGVQCVHLCLPPFDIRMSLSLLG